MDKARRKCSAMVDFMAEKDTPQGNGILQAWCISHVCQPQRHCKHCPCSAGCSQALCTSLIPPSGMQPKRATSWLSSSCAPVLIIPDGRAHKNQTEKMHGRRSSGEGYLVKPPRACAHGVSRTAISFRNLILCTGSAMSVKEAGAAAGVLLSEAMQCDTS
jgi:hypothetical protein